MSYSPLPIIFVLNRALFALKRASFQYFENGTMDDPKRGCMGEWIKVWFCGDGITSVVYINTICFLNRLNTVQVTGVGVLPFVEDRTKFDTKRLF